MIGGGPAGLFAAETLALGGAAVTVYERMPSVGRKFLLAGRGGLNLTHSEPRERFVARYRPADGRLRAALDAFPPDALRAWADGLGEPTFAGSSGRVFPDSWKASPLLRAWLARLAALGVAIRPRHLWTGFGAGTACRLRGPAGEPVEIRPDAVVLALGGASWPRLGADGSWLPAFAEARIAARPLRPSNMALHVPWSEAIRERFLGIPLKRAAFGFAGQVVRGEAVVTAAGLEGGPVYALSGPVRDALEAGSAPRLELDLRPDLPEADLARALARPRGRLSTANVLRRQAGLSPLATALLREGTGGPLPVEPAALAALVKATRLAVTGTGGLERAISSAGGVSFAALDSGFMLRDRPGIFVAGEMIDWEAPTGGYLLQACFATGRAAAEACLARPSG